jgi:hypothetical protein
MELVQLRGKGKGAGGDDGDAGDDVAGSNGAAAKKKGKGKKKKKGTDEEDDGEEDGEGEVAATMRKRRKSEFCPRVGIVTVIRSFVLLQDSQLIKVLPFLSSSRQPLRLDPPGPGCSVRPSPPSCIT